MNMMYKLFAFAIFLMLVTACNKTDDEQPISDDRLGEGILVINEGPFMSGTGTITFHGETTKNNVFETVNGRPLGNIVQSYAHDEEFGFIVVNNADKVEVVNPATFKSLATIQGLSSPRYMIKLNENQWAVSEWTNEVNGRISIIETPGFSITQTIQVGAGPEEMVIHDGNLYVINSGGFGSSNTVSVISMDNLQVVNTMEVCDNPNSVKLIDGDLLVLCGGNKVYNEDFSLNEEASTHGRLVSISSGSPVSLWTASHVAERPNNLLGAGSTKLFLSSAGIYRFDHTTGEASLLKSGFYYALSAGSNLRIYATDAADYASNGTAIAIHAGSGDVIETYEAGIIPRQVVEISE